MAEPTRLKLKRRATEELPPSCLIFHGLKIARTPKTLHYVLQSEGRIPKAPTKASDAAKHKTQSSERLFQLQAASSTGKRKATDDGGVATIVEKKQNKQDVTHATEQAEVEDYSAARPLKRPSRGTAVRRKVDKYAEAETEAGRNQRAALADYMHQAALEEVKRESQARTVASPKLSGARSRQIHQQRVASNASSNTSGEVEVEDDSSYVYETYILAPTTELDAYQLDMQPELGNVGYIVMTKEDQSLWETYLEEELGDQGDISDEDDENAEDYYGADYPEDEIASDDELGRNAYGYRGRASDDEEWDENTAAWSDDEDDRIKDPWSEKKTLSQFDKYFRGEIEHDSD